jgi:hypothetical protein
MNKFNTKILKKTKISKMARQGVKKAAPKASGKPHLPSTQFIIH